MQIAQPPAGVFLSRVCFTDTLRDIRNGTLLYVTKDSWLMFYQPSENWTLLFNPLIAGKTSYFLIWQPPALPHRLQCSTIGRSGLNRRVRDGNGCVPRAHRRQKHWALSEVLSSLVRKLFRSSALEPPLLYASSYQIDNSTVKHILFSTCLPL